MYTPKFRKSVPIHSLYSASNLTDLSRRLEDDGDPVLLVEAAAHNYRVAKIYHKMSLIKASLDADGEITKQIAESIDNVLNGGLSREMNMNGFTQQPSGIGLKRVKEILKLRMSNVVMGSDFDQNRKYIKDSLTDVRIENVLRLLKIIGLRDAAGATYKPLGTSAREVVEKVLRDLGYDEVNQYGKTDQEVVDMLGSVETIATFRSSIIRTLAHQDDELNNESLTAVMSKNTAKDLKVIRAYARLCSNLPKIVPSL